MPKLFKTTITLEVIAKDKPLEFDEAFWDQVRQAHADMDGVLLAGTSLEDGEISRAEAAEAIEDLDEILKEEEVTCKLCGERCDASTAHLHQGGYICDENCWDDRLKVTA